MIRSAWVIVTGPLITLWYAVWAVLGTLLPEERAAAMCRWSARGWGRGMLRVAGVKLELVGAENLGTGRSQVLVSNHESWFDVWAYAAVLPVDSRFVAKQELGGIPIFGRSLRVCGHVSVNRADRASAIESIDRATERLEEEGMTMVLFAEGTRSPDGNLLPFKKGPFVIALQKGVPVIPAAVIGGRDVMPKGTFRVRSARMTIRIGEPISVEGLGFEDRDLLRDRTRAAVAELKAAGHLGSPGPAAEDPPSERSA